MGRIPVRLSMQNQILHCLGFARADLPGFKMDAVLSEHSYRGGRIVEGRLMFELSDHYMKRVRETL